jgi:hypothetical protein
MYVAPSTLSCFTLTRSCDAEPDVLADYFIAWLITDSDPVRASWSEQQWEEYAATDLQDFLGEHAVPFAKAAFETIRSKSYVVAPPPSEPAQPAPVAAAQPHPLPANPMANQGDVEMGDGQKPRERCRDYHGAFLCHPPSTFLPLPVHPADPRTRLLHARRRLPVRAL